MPSLESKSYLNLSTGLITEGAVSEYRAPLDTVTESLNWKFNRIGAATSRDGTTLLGNQLSGDTLGLHEFRDSGAGTNNQLLMVNDNTLYYLSSNSWTSKRTGLTVGAKARFTTFLDFVWMVNNENPTAIWDGNPSNSFVTSGNVSGAPVGKFIENFRSRVWILGNNDYPDRVWFSSLPSSVTTPVVTWDTSVTTGDWINISPQDGENITGGIRTRKALLVFKNNHIYPIFSINQTEPDPVTNVGTYSHESIVPAKDGTYFHHPSGFYRYNVGTEPQEVSKAIVDIVGNISASEYGNINGWLETNGDNIVWAVGDVTIGGTTFSNLEVRYTISTQTWTHYSKPAQALTHSRYDDGSTLFQLIGDDDGNILKVDTGLDDNGTPISLSLIHRWAQIDGLSSTRKDITKMLFAHKEATGLNIGWQNEEFVENEWTPLAQLEEFNTVVNNANVRGRKLRFRVSGHVSGEPVIYNGFETLEGNSELIAWN